MKNQSIVTLLFSLLALQFAGCSNEPLTTPAASSKKLEKPIDTSASRPNIIFYLADDQDITDYGVYGNEKVHTPSVDRLAHEGIMFKHAFTAQAICAPSRTQLFTGKYPLKNGAFANHTPTRPNIKSVTKQMRALGYEVVLAGKSHVKPASVYDWDQEWQPVPKKGVPRDYIPLADIEKYFQTTTKPFVMFIASKYPHGKYFDVKNPDADKLKFHPFDQHLKSNKKYIKKRAGYYRSIEEDNTQLAHVLRMVDTHLTDNTLFIYSADHGVSGKFSVKDIGLNVPFVVRWPSVIKAGSRSEQLVHYTDVLPTFIDAAGGQPEPSMDGKSFLNILKGEDKAIHQYVYGVRTNQNIINARVFPSRMIRDIRYKYIRNFNALEVLDQNLTDKANINAFLELGAQRHKNEPFEELYDLTNDPFEQNNLISEPSLITVKARLQTQLFAWMKTQGDFLNEGFGNVPIITAPTFKLDQNKPPIRTDVPKALQNTLNPEDYFIIDHWRK
ncbi:sulfatase [Paraglaciecola aquimarina]|uniref:Sulfatase n=1 Tax=Paraglaciecola algarum TaxID=3050085 RepID=A0ABS9D3C3_9ALTE|nr:sulfatase [Paraglaciecola sp. G1-23]MCF2946937.1 sulfatase [Paraglaciecola sp. G1-23]